MQNLGGNCQSELHNFGFNARKVLGSLRLEARDCRSDSAHARLCSFCS
jgi:hypothetical protein